MKRYILNNPIAAWLRRMSGKQAQSKRVDDQALIARFVADERNTFLVSFPRTGSHWLRMLMELYFERPTLVRTFYYPQSTDFLLLHTHDLDLSLQRNRVIYLYRTPVDTIFSQLRYERERHDDETRIRYWAALYGRHLDKWLNIENFTTQKTLITYEAMTNNLTRAFARITAHFGQDLEPGKLRAVSATVTKEEVKRKTIHDQQVVQLSGEYAEMRHDFKETYSQLIWDTVLGKRPRLADRLLGL